MRPRARSGLRAAVAFLTPASIPSRHQVASRSGPDASALSWFPVVGAAIGGSVALGWRAARWRLGPLGAASVAVLADVAATGALHLDGLADSADGLFAHAASKDRLSIMAEPAVGAFGVLALSSAVVVKTAALSELDPSPALLAATCCASRSLMALACRTLPYARPGGLASGLLPGSPGEQATDAPDLGMQDAGEGGDSGLTAGRQHDVGNGGRGPRPELAAVAGLIGAVIVAGAAEGPRSAVGVLAGLSAGVGVLALAERRLGGFTGDVLGAAGVVTEIVALVVASAGRRARDPLRQAPLAVGLVS